MSWISGSNKYTCWLFVLKFNRFIYKNWWDEQEPIAMNIYSLQSRINWVWLIAFGSCRRPTSKVTIYSIYIYPYHLVWALELTTMHSQQLAMIKRIQSQSEIHLISRSDPFPFQSTQFSCSRWLNPIQNWSHQADEREKHAQPSEIRKFSFHSWRSCYFV